MKSDDNNVINKIMALGETPDKVADNLRRLKFFGRRGDCYWCPLSLYLDNKDRGFVTVGKTYVVCVVPDKKPTKHRLPPAAAEFVSRFDDGLYPDLEEKEHEEC